MIFRDRTDAGRRLAPKLLPWRGEDPIVLALPRGGMPVGWEVARALRAPLDVLVVRKIGAPGQPELGIGAVAPDGVRWVDPALARLTGATPADVEEIARRESAERDRRAARYRAGRGPLEVAGRTVILVDDGVATGGTVRAAILWLRREPAARRVVVATPVAAAATARALRVMADAVVCVEEPEDLSAVGAWYDDFSQTTDETVVDLLGRPTAAAGAREATIPLEAEGLRLSSELALPDDPQGVVVFAHGSGSGRASPRNRRVAAALRAAGFGTLLLDLLSDEEQAAEEAGAQRRFDIRLLASRLMLAVHGLRGSPLAQGLPVGLFGASTGAAAALVAAAQAPEWVGAVVSRGGRPDLAGPGVLEAVRAPTLYVVGGDDAPVLALHREVMPRMRAPARLVVVPGATHLFEEPGTLDQVAALAAAWFAEHLGAPPDAA